MNMIEKYHHITNNKIDHSIHYQLSVSSNFQIERGRLFIHTAIIRQRTQLYTLYTIYSFVSIMSSLVKCRDFRKVRNVNEITPRALFSLALMTSVRRLHACTHQARTHARMVRCGSRARSLHAADRFILAHKARCQTLSDINMTTANT